MSSLHRLLAVMSLVIVLLAGLEGVVRAWNNRPPGMLAARVNATALLLLGMTSAGGLGLLVGGNRPHERLHLLYAVLAFAALPLASVISTTAVARWRGLATMLGALIALVLILRLFATG
jgi:hypothetical protein